MQPSSSSDWTMDPSLSQMCKPLQYRGTVAVYNQFWQDPAVLWKYTP